MRNIGEIHPYIVAAHPYRYDGSVYEQTRKGYSYAFHLFREGSGAVYVQGKKYDAAKGTLIFIPPGREHAFQVEPGRTLFAHNIYCHLGPVSDAGKEHRFGYASDPFFSEWGMDIPALPELELLPTASSLAENPFLTEHFIQTVQLFQEELPYRQELTKAYWYAWILRWYQEVVVRPKPMDPRIIELLRAVEDKDAALRDSQAWNEYCGLGKSYFHKLFKRETGVNPRQYLIRRKLNKTATLLVESQISITELADQLGYESIHFFSRQFTAHFGISPGAYRRSKRML